MKYNYIIRSAAIRAICSLFRTEGGWEQRIREIDTHMDVAKMLTELRQEREHIEEAILTLERLAQGRGRRRGRPPAWMTEIKRRGRPPGSKNKPKAEGPKAAAQKTALAAAS